MAISFISFSNSPVFISPTEDEVPATGLSYSHLIAATSCDVGFESQLEAAKFLGKAPISNDYNVVGPSTAKISIQYLPLVGDRTLSGISSASTGILNLTGDFNSGHQIRFGNVLFKQCYLDSINLSLTANQPLRISAQFSSYDSSSFANNVYSGFVNSGGFVVDSLFPTNFSCVHALSTNVSGQSVSLPLSKTDISIQTTCSRQPIYDIGNTVPTRVVLNSVERVTSVNGENVGEIINFSGQNANLSLKFAEFGALVTGESFSAATDYRFSVDISGKINSQSLSAQPGRSLEGSVQIQESIF